MRALAALVLTLGLVVPAASTAASASGYRPPRTAAGTPDLEGIWNNASMTTLERRPAAKTLVLTPQEAAAIEGQRNAVAAKRVGTVDPKAPAPAKSDGDVGQQLTEWGDDLRLARIKGEIRSSWIVDPPDGKLPLTPAAAARRKAERRERVFDGPEAAGLGARCLMGLAGPPLQSFGYNSNVQIVQTSEAVVIVSEMNHDARIVRLADRRPLPDAIRPWMGDSVGHWEGDTLVVETRHLHPLEAAQLAVQLSENGKLTERFTRVADDQILYEFRVEDPETYTRTWRAEMVLNRAKGPIYEVACHEGNYSLPNMLAGARAQEKAAANGGAKSAASTAR